MRKLDGRIVFLIKAFVSLMFISKISLAGLLPVPRSFSFLLFQAGMHPYLNVILSFLTGIPLLFLWMRMKNRNHLSGFYKLFCLVLILLLIAQTFLQMNYVYKAEPRLMELAAMVTSVFMVVICGLVIPSAWDVKSFVKFVQRWAGILVLVSLAMLFFSKGAAFKGGRFIGVFKHIPHMVTCATVAFVFSLTTFIDAKRRTERLWNAIIIGTSFFAIILTGTRSSAAAAVVAFILTMILHKTKTNQGRLFKFAFITISVSFTLLFGLKVYDFVRSVAMGKAALGSREAQDGVASRWEEVERGAQMFRESPWLGHGLASKFASGEDVSVSSYNAMKDPHNILISAGVIGGWPLLFMGVIALVLMTIGGLKALKSPDLFKRQVAIYLCAHIPILIIYHIHLSLGGMADRLYWLVFGFVAAASASWTYAPPQERDVTSK